MKEENKFYLTLLPLMKFEDLSRNSKWENKFKNSICDIRCIWNLAYVKEGCAKNSYMGEGHIEKNLRTEDGEWIIRNRESCKLFSSLQIISAITSSKLIWIRHVERTKQQNTIRYMASIRYLVGRHTKGYEEEEVGMSKQREMIGV